MSLIFTVMPIFVGHLPKDFDQNAFEAFVGGWQGVVRRIDVPVDRETGQLRGFAHVHMECEDDERRAISGYQGVEFRGSKLSLSYIKPRK